MKIDCKLYFQNYKALTVNNLEAHSAAVATFGQNLRRIREARGLTQEVLAQRLELKRSAQISLVESGDGLPRPETIIKYAEALHCAPYELLQEVETGYDKIRSQAPDQSRHGERLKPSRPPKERVGASPVVEARALEEERRKNAEMLAAIGHIARTLAKLATGAVERQDSDAAGRVAGGGRHRGNHRG